MENLELAEKIAIEKRKRHQTYMALDYLLSINTYFDFFSPEAFTIIKNAKYLAQQTNKSINIDWIFLSYFYSDAEILKMFKNFGFLNKLEENLLASFPDIKIIETKKRKTPFISFEKIIELFSSAKPKISQTNFYSHEVLQLFEKAIENSLTRFKTPVITPEILFITLMEEKSTKISKIIKMSFDNEMEWYLFRYNLIKLIHNQESTIRGEVTKNQQYFAYLLKTQLNDFEFNRLIENKALNKGVLIFRNDLISNILKVNILDELLTDINNSIKVTSKRSYSS
jgi:hypothetical protein